jgi:fumarate hydratase, class I
VSHYSIADILSFGGSADYERLDLPAPEPTAAGGIALPAATLEALAERAFSDIAFFMPIEHVRAIAAILDPSTGSTEADRFVAGQLLRNAAIAAEGILPVCQDTGTALAYGWKGALVSTEGGDEGAIASGAAKAYAARLLRKSQLAPASFLEEANTGDNLPALVDLRAAAGAEYRFCFAAKGGGSANKTVLTMESPAILEGAALEARMSERVAALGASACPPYRISAVLGGSGPDQALYVLALAGLGLLDGLPARRSGGAAGGSAGATGPLRDPEWEQKILGLAAATGVGSQFGGSGLALDARAIRLTRHAASLSLATGVSCSAHRKARAIVSREGVYLEALERDPGRLLPASLPVLPNARRVDLDAPQRELGRALGSMRPGDFLLLSGTVVTARDAAHARFRRLVEEGRSLPSYLFEHPVFYAGPTEAAPGMASGSFGPTTAGRMDAYMPMLASRGASLVSIAKGGRSRAAAEAIGAAGGAYLACIGGAAALAAREHVVSSEVIDHADLGMEAVRRVVLCDLPAMLVVGGSGRDFYEELAARP